MSFDSLLVEPSASAFGRRASLQNVVGLDPARRAERQARLRARGLFARALPIPVAQIALSGREHGHAFVPLQRIGACQGAVAEPEFRFGREAALQLPNRLVDVTPVLGGGE